MTLELTYLTLVALLTAVLWFPYTLNMISIRGLVTAVGYPVDPWAARLKAAHYNAVENLVVFAPLVLVAHLVGVSNESTVIACEVYFWARLVHPIAYTFAIPWVRTLAFALGALCQLSLAVEILG
jgi:uncharacterized MAPEG superfamily protein